MATNNINKSVLDFLQELYRLQPVGTLSETICRRLPGLIGAENAILCGHDGSRRVITSVTARHPFSRANLMPHINESGIMATHPFWEGIFDNHRPVRALSDVTSRTEWHRQTLYQEVFRPDGIEDQLNMEILGNPQSFLTVNVLRRRRGFTTSEQELFLLLRPHLGQAMQNAILAGQIGLMPAISDTRGLIPVDCHGRLRITDGPATAWLKRWFGKSGYLPDGVARWIVEQSRRLNAGWLETHITPLAFTDENRTWLFTLYRDYEHGHYTLAAERIDQLVPSAALSPREAAIMNWVAAGKANEEIATILSISTNTVKTHLKRIFVKLGVENRTTAALRWQERSSDRLHQH